MTTTIPKPPPGYEVRHDSLWRNYIERSCLFDVEPKQLAAMLNAKTPAKLDTLGIERSEDRIAGDERALFIRGKLLKTLLTRIADKPAKNCDFERPMNSIGVQGLAVAATDGRSAVEIGWPTDDECYQSTSRKAALLEAEREMIYTDGADVHELERLRVGEDLAPYPDVTKILWQCLDDSSTIGQFDPELLKRACEVALAAGSSTITLMTATLRREGDEAINGIGFEFETVPDDDQLDLFGYAGSVPVRGVVVGKRKLTASVDDEEEGEE